MYKIAVITNKIRSTSPTADLSYLIHDYQLASTRYGHLTSFHRFTVSGPSVWNKLPATLRVSPTLGQFQSKLKAVLFCSAYET